MKILIAGASGFYGRIICNYFNEMDLDVYGIDRVESVVLHKNKQFICDLCDYNALERALKEYLRFDILIHFATELDFQIKDQNKLYQDNIKMTKNLIEIAKIKDVRNFIFTSSNSIYLGNCKNYITHNEIPSPIDAYGHSKIESEKLLLAHSDYFFVNIIRCPLTIDSGRVGMLSILFELVHSNATLWVIGKGDIIHQCLYAKDLNCAINKIINLQSNNIFHIGSDNIPTFKELFAFLIKESNSNSKLRTIPEWFAIPLLKLLFKLRLSPLGPYQFRMLTQNFEFDLTHIKRKLNWKPTKNNSEMLLIAYESYLNNMSYEGNRVAGNSSSVKMGLLGLLKLIKI